MRFTLIGENQETIGFADLNVLAETVGFTYPQALRAKEILDDMELDVDAQTVMGLLFEFLKRRRKRQSVSRRFPNS